MATHSSCRKVFWFLILMCFWNFMPCKWKLNTVKQITWTFINKNSYSSRKVGKQRFPKCSLNCPKLFLNLIIRRIWFFDGEQRLYRRYSNCFICLYEVMMNNQMRNYGQVPSHAKGRPTHYMYTVWCIKTVAGFYIISSLQTRQPISRD